MVWCVSKIWTANAARMDSLCGIYWLHKEEEEEEEEEKVEEEKIKRQTSNRSLDGSFGDLVFKMYFIY